MFAWYRRATICYAYLSDFAISDDMNEFSRSRWFTRGWTLQELLAPKGIKFYSKNWSFIGLKSSKVNELIYALADITKISKSILTHDAPLQSASIAVRMSWAAERETSRPEDMAYCLLGIFDIHMHMLYGEGRRAFQRLQEEIIQTTNDRTIFIWRAAFSPRGASTLFDDHPLAFQAPMQMTYLKRDLEPYAMTNRDLRIDAHLIQIGVGLYIMVTDSCCDSGPHYDPTTREYSPWIGIVLGALDSGGKDFVRVNPSQLAIVYSRPINSRTICVRQVGMNSLAPRTLPVQPDEQVYTFDSSFARKQDMRLTPVDSSPILLSSYTQRDVPYTSWQTLCWTASWSPCKRDNIGYGHLNHRNGDSMAIQLSTLERTDDRLIKFSHYDGLMNAHGSFGSGSFDAKLVISSTDLADSGFSEMQGVSDGLPRTIGDTRQLIGWTGTHTSRVYVETFSDWGHRPFGPLFTVQAWNSHDSPV